MFYGDITTVLMRHSPLVWGGLHGRVGQADEWLKVAAVLCRMPSDSS